MIVQKCNTLELCYILLEFLNILYFPAYKMKLFLLYGPKYCSVSHTLMMFRKRSEFLLPKWWCILHNRKYSKRRERYSQICSSVSHQTYWRLSSYKTILSIAYILHARDNTGTIQSLYYHHIQWLIVYLFINYYVSAMGAIFRQLVHSLLFTVNLYTSSVLDGYRNQTPILLV
jgi:hypothetical protein